MTTAKTEAFGYMHASPPAKKVRKQVFSCVLVPLAIFAAGCTGHAPVVVNGPVPPYCESIKQAYATLFGVQRNDVESHKQAAYTAAQRFREAAQVAPAELTDAIRGLAAFYEQAALSGDDIGLRQIQDLLGYSNKLREVAKIQCNFTIDDEQV